jgi:chemotaxis signal transduction protein
MSSVPRQIVRFTAGEGEFGIDVTRAVEVVPADRLVPLPHPGTDVVGVVDRGGTAVAVVAVLGSLPGPGSEHILLVDTGEGELVGLLVGQVHTVITVPVGLLAAAPPGQQRPMVEAIIPGDDGMVMVIDPRQLPRWSSPQPEATQR